MTQNAWNETLAEIIEDTASSMSDDDQRQGGRVPREELHAYLAPGKGHKGKGKSPRRGEPWSRRQRRTADTHRISEEESTDPSMPDLLVDADNDNDNADVRDVVVELTTTGQEIVHA